MKYILGLDLGITSVGWAIYNHDTSLIERCGVRLFNAAEHPKDKSSLATPRREARGQRRRVRRRAYRMNTIKQHLINSGLINAEDLKSLYTSTNKTEANKSRYDVYYLRYNALSTLLSNHELTQVLIHLAKHRGFKSNRKKDKSVDGVVNSSLSANSQLLQEKNYQTVGEMLHKDEKFNFTKRNRFGEYSAMLQRADIEKEVQLILEKQRNFGNQLITKEFVGQYLKIFNWQKSFDWRGNIREMVGKCQFEKAESRAPKACFSSEKFIALSKLNNIIYTHDSIEKRLSSEEIRQIFSKALTKKSGLNFKDIRKELDISDEARFNFVKYNSNEDFLEIEGKTQIKELKFQAYHELKSAIEDACGNTTWNNLMINFQLLDQIIVELTYNKTDDAIIKSLNHLFLNDPLANRFTTDEKQQIITTLINNGISFDKNMSLSLKALYKIIPYLEQGYQYDKACKEANYNHSQQDNLKNPRLPSIQKIGLDQELTNPVVTRAISQMRKVVNTIIEKYGTPYQINIELARDVGKSIEQRSKIEKQNKDNNALNQRLFDDFASLNNNRKPAKDELIKFKLWKQQGERCMYSGEYINFTSLLNGTNDTQIDHIIPYSRSFDDSLTNKVLCLTRENQRKGNRTPFEYIGAGGHNFQNWHIFEERCSSMNKSGYQLGFSPRKLQLLLLKKLDEQGFIERNLNDTRYISRFCKNYLENHLEFADKSNKKPVRSLTGQVTAFVRSNWGLIKSRDENDLHHAQDACVIAAMTTKMEQEITKYMRARDYGRNPDLTYTDPKTGEIFDKFPMPNINYRTNVIQKVSEVFVSRMPNRVISGVVHLDTIRSRKYIGNPKIEYNSGKPFSTISKQLTASGIKLDKDGEIPSLCPTYKQHNLNIYRLLQDRLKLHGNDCKKAFLEPLNAPRKDGSRSDVQIKTVKIIQTQYTGVKVNNGIADNGGMVRIDIFNQDGKNYIIPIYLSDVIRDKLPDKAIIANKPESEWSLIDTKANFLFSLYPKDLVKVITKKETYFGYYTGTDRATGAITILLHDGSDEIRSVGIKINTNLEKYQVDVLGNYTKIEKETRLDFSRMKNKSKEK